ncbi:hypothetical protein HanIR_Chr01g0048431 [Helianthus annuus]|nr:hypothetical protein HanIR_Chr01g0048431 [Helianthus annuus]
MVGTDGMILREWNAFWNRRFHSIDQPNTLFFILSQWSILFLIRVLSGSHIGLSAHSQSHVSW